MADGLERTQPGWESVMTSKVQIKRLGFTLGSALVLCASGAFAATPADGSAARPVHDTRHGPGRRPDLGKGRRRRDDQSARSARAHGGRGRFRDVAPRFIWRTRMIYNFSYQDSTNEECPSVLSGPQFAGPAELHQRRARAGPDLVRRLLRRCDAEGRRSDRIRRICVPIHSRRDRIHTTICRNCRIFALSDAVRLHW